MKPAGSSSLSSSAGPPATRRHHTRQRAELLRCLRSCRAHPTAAELHSALRDVFPRLSLGTVYRNLEVLIAEGEIESVPGGRGPARYDSNPHAHHHFRCEHCGELRDIELPEPRSLARRLRERYALEARRVRIEFLGSCAACEPRR